MGRTSAQSFFATVLTAGVGSEGLTFDVDTTGDLSGACYLVVDVRNEEGRDVIRAEVTSPTRFTCASLDDRFLPGSAASSGLAHEPGVEVWSVPLSQNLDDLWDAIEAIDATATSGLSALDARTSTAESAIVALQTAVGVNTKPVIDAVASGSIPLPWTGSVASIPAGFQLADGTNGTPDLTDLFLLGSGDRDVGDTGGSEDAIVVSHNHAGPQHNHPMGHSHGSGSYTAESHQHEIGARTTSSSTHTHSTSADSLARAGNVGSGWTQTASDTSFSGGLNVSGTSGGSSSSSTGNAGTGNTGSRGSSGAGANMPPYYTVAWIVYVGV